MKRILFVDDEPRILEGLQRQLRPERRSWEMVFALGGEAALAELDAAPFDVVVSDMRMPGIDGATLLRHVRDRFPHMARIILSGHTELEAAVRAAQVAHQFLSKPAEPGTIKSVVERVCNLQNLLADDKLRRIVGEMGGLPSSPRVFGELSQALQNPKVSLAELAEIIQQDVALCAKCLQLVNSAFFGLPRRVANVVQAVAYLGTDTLRNLVSAHEIFRTFEPGRRVDGFDPDQLSRHASLTANIAGQLLPHRPQAEEAFVAGLLHDAGKLILATYVPEQLETIVTLAEQRGQPFHLVEREVLGVGHAEIGAYLLGHWGLPFSIVEAVAYHHAAKRVNLEQPDVSSAVYVANLLAQEQSVGMGAIGRALLDELDGAAGSTVAAERLSAWRALAEQAAARQEV